MAWSADAARPLTEAFDGALGEPGTVIAVACIDHAETAIEVNPGDTPADGRFEVGSVTKTMTATLLAQLAAEGSLRLDDGVGRWLPADANAGITLRQLATHTSGLPRLAPNMRLPTVDLANPYAELGVEQAEEGLRQAVAAPGAPVLYSNFGYQLLGLVLERASGLPYAQLITDRLLTPLGMSAPARSSGCCWTGGPRRSGPAPRTPSGNGCSPSGWTCPGTTGRRTSASRSISRSAAGGQTAVSWPTPRSRSRTARSACGSASSRRARSQA